MTVHDDARLERLFAEECARRGLPDSGFPRSAENAADGVAALAPGVETITAALAGAAPDELPWLAAALAAWARHIDGDDPALDTAPPSSGVHPTTAIVRLRRFLEARPRIPGRGVIAETATATGTAPLYRDDLEAVMAAAAERPAGGGAIPIGRGRRTR